MLLALTPKRMTTFLYMAGGPSMPPVHTAFWKALVVAPTCSCVLESVEDMPQSPKAVSQRD